MEKKINCPYCGKPLQYVNGWYDIDYMDCGNKNCLLFTKLFKLNELKFSSDNTLSDSEIEDKKREIILKETVLGKIFQEFKETYMDFLFGGAMQDDMKEIFQTELSNLSKME